MANVDRNICRLCGEARAVRDGRNPLLKENYSDKILQFAGKINVFLFF